jgi:uncharacterized tellurite resistance protein B-like protein
MNAENLGYRALNVSLGKLLIAAAWVDGEINEEESACLKNLILKMPGISFADWRRLKIYLAYPLSLREQEFVVNEFSEKVFVEDHSKLAWEALLEVLKADGNINVLEKGFAQELEQAFKENLQGFLRTIKFYLFRDSIESQQAWKSQTMGREKLIHEFFDNPVYFLFRKALIQENLAVPHSKPELQKVCLFAAILSWVAAEDGRISLDEEELILGILINTCGIVRSISECILKVAKSLEINELQLEDLSSSLADSTEQNEREELFIALSNLVILDKVLTVHEWECLRTVAIYLGIRKVVWQKTMEKIRLKTTITEA